MTFKRNIIIWMSIAGFLVPAAIAQTTGTTTVTGATPEAFAITNSSDATLSSTIALGTLTPGSGTTTTALTTGEAELRLRSNKAMGVAGRCAIEAGDFFTSMPAGGDTYIMKNIIHDWNDEKSILILKNIASRLKGNPLGKLVLLEFALSPGNEPQFGKWADVEMLALPGGRERTEQEYRELFSRAGFRLTRIVPTKSPQSVIEAALS